MAWVQSMSTGTVVAGASAVAVCVAVLTAVSSKIRRKKRSAITEAFEEVAVEVDGKALDEGLSPAVDTDGKATYDFVIVGGGTAGCVLAARLSENPDFTVLLLEAGGSERHNQYHQIPLAFSELFHSKADWNFYTEKQDYADGKPRFWPRGKMLGGCSSINGMICHYGPPSDYDEWAKLAGDGGSGWAYDQFKKYFLKFEKFIPNMEYPGVDTSLRGTSGPVGVGFFTHRTNFSRKFLDACVNIGIPQNDDLNTIRGTLGVCQPMTFVDNKGTRISMETAYLTPEVLSRPNLTVLTHAQATRILFDLSGEEKRAIGVEFARNTEGREGTRFRVKARKEVVISAGAIHSPHLLLLSGIGPAADLATHQIPVVEDLPGVGSHLMDHTMVKTQIRIKEGEGLNYLNPRHEEGPIGKMRATRDFWRWKLGGRGPMASNMVETVAFLRSTDPNIFPSYAYPDQLEDSASSPLAPDIEAIGLPSAFIDHGLGEVPPGDVGCIFLINLRPTSLGRVWLKSADPFDAPLIDPKYLSTQHDITILTRGLHFLLRLSQTEPLSSWVGHNESDPRLDHHWNLDLSPSHQTSTNSNHFVNHYANTLPKLTSEAKLRTETVYHPTSTARMAPRDEGGVVDPELCVYGVKGLRICDASVFPTITASHTAAPVIATAEKAVDLIKATY